MHPRLLHSLVLLDPVIQTANAGIAPAVASTRRRDLWDSRDAAAAAFARSAFYRAWDPRVLERWVRHGLRRLPTELYPATSTKPDDDERVTLTTTKHQELFTFLRPTYPRGRGYGVPDREDFENPDPDHPGYPFYRPEPLAAFRRLPELRPSVLYVFGAESDLSTPAQREAKMRRTGTGIGGSGGAAKGRVREVVLDCGHLVAMERVPQCADAIAGFLPGELARWREAQSEVEEGRKGRERREMITIDETWKREIKPRSRSAAKL